MLLEIRYNMKKHFYNDTINVYEIDFKYLEEGIRAAERKNLDSIRIESFDEESNFKNELDLLPLFNKTFIKKLIIGDSFKLKSVKNIDAIYSLKELNDLTLALPLEIDFSYLKQLEKLFVNNHSYKNLESLINLKQLYFARYSKENCEELQNLKELTYLRIDGSRKLISLEGIENLNNLNTIWLVFNNQLSDANSIAKLDKLEWIWVEGCKNLLDYSFLSNNNSIKKLLISDLDSLDFVRNMNKLENINFWNCKSGDLSPLLENLMLKEVSFSPQRKHYSHKKDEINNILFERNK